MPVRPFRFPSDFQTIEQLTLQAYVYPPDTGWMTRSLQEQEAQNFVAMLRAAKRFWPLIRVGQVFSPGLRYALKGFLWEEGDQPVGLVATGQGADRNWWIANVAVLPGYRRRGIGRCLVQAAMDCARKYGGKAATLDVISDNLPALRLYEQVGFEIYNGSVEMIAPDDPLTSMPILSGYTARRLTTGEWQPHFQVAHRITPPQVQKYRPISRERFRPSRIGKWINRMMEPASGVSNWGIAVDWQANQEPVATAQLTARTRPGGFNEFNVRIDPAHPAAASYILKAGISQLQNDSPGRPIHIHMYSWQAPFIQTALEIGCAIRHRYSMMGMKLEDDVSI